MNCQWCGRTLNDDFGYSETGEIICASYSTHNRVYSACKARSHRLRQKIAKRQDKGTVANPDALQGQSALIEALQIIINQNDELIALQRQQLAQPRTQLVKEETIKTIQTTREFSTPDFEDDLMDGIEIKQDKSTDSVQNLLASLDKMQNIQAQPKEKKAGSRLQ